MSECPLCQQQNNCGALQGQTACWCMTAVIPEQALARVPAEFIDKACICEACAEKYAQKEPTG